MTTENRNHNDLCAEEHFTPQEIGKTLKMDPQTVVRLFRGQPGVIEWGSDERLHKRKRKFLRISKSALERFLAKQRTGR